MTNTETQFVIITSVLTIPLLIALFYSFHKSRKKMNDNILMTIVPKKKGRSIYGVVISFIFGIISVSLIFTGLYREIKGLFMNVVSWAVLLQISLFFGVLAFIFYKRRKDSVYMQFTDKGIILSQKTYREIFTWDEIDEIEWEYPKDIFGVIYDFKKNISNGTILFVRSGWRWRRFYHPVSEDEKQQINLILKSRGKLT